VGGHQESARSEHTRPTLLLLARHAVTADTGTVLTGRTPGIGLSESGREQAAALADRLRPLAPNALFASPVQRTQETAAAIAGRTGLDVRPLPGIVESDLGKWTGERLEDLAKLDEWSTVQHAPSRFRFPGGESFAEIHARTIAALDAVVDEHPGERVVVVAHADPIRVALAHYAGAHLDQFQRFVVAPASVSVVAISPQGPVLIRTNDTGPLSDLVPPRDRDKEER